MNMEQIKQAAMTQYVAENAEYIAKQIMVHGTDTIESIILISILNKLENQLISLLNQGTQFTKLELSLNCRSPFFTCTIGRHDWSNDFYGDNITQLANNINLHFN